VKLLIAYGLLPGWRERIDRPEVAPVKLEDTALPTAKLPAS
jgi:hypothetical protein